MLLCRTPTHGGSLGANGRSILTAVRGHARAGCSPYASHQVPPNAGQPSCPILGHARAIRRRGSVICQDALLSNRSTRLPASSNRNRALVNRRRTDPMSRWSRLISSSAVMSLTMIWARVSGPLSRMSALALHWSTEKSETAPAPLYDFGNVFAELMSDQPYRCRPCKPANEYVERECDGK